MKNRKSILFVLGVVLVLMAAASAANAPKLTFKFTKVNVHGAVATFPGGVNNSGVMVGSYTDTSGASHGFMLKGKKLTTIDDPNGLPGSTSCNGINPNGTIAIVGNYVSTSGDFGFLYQNGTFTDIPGPGGSIAASANAIDDKGNIVGWYQDPSTTVHGFLLSGFAYTTLDVPGAFGTAATGINNHGSIVVTWTDSSGAVESSLYDGKTYKTINVPGAADSQANGINSAGDVVYTWFDSKVTGHGALRHAGKYYKFGFPKSAYNFANGINDHHLIVGAYETTKGRPVSGYKATYK
jgi:uncharacterized membrane protein